MDQDFSFLRHILLYHCNHFFRSIHLEGNRLGRQHISLSAGADLNQLIVSIVKRFGQHQHTGAVGIEGIKIDGVRIVDVLHNQFSGIGIANLESETGYRNNPATLCIPFLNPNRRLEYGVVNEIAVYFAVLADEHIEIFH